MNILRDLNKAMSALKRGQAVVYPTDTIFGLAVNALDETAVERVYKIKNRPSSKPLPIIISSFEVAQDLAHINKQQVEILRAFWPGPVTVVLKKKKVLPDNLTAGKETVAMRWPDFEIACQLAGEFPITATSANLSGRKVEQTVSGIQEHFESHLPQPDCILAPSSSLDYSRAEMQPSTILDITNARRPKVLRTGAVGKEKIKKVLEL